MIKVLMADDHAILRHGLKQLFVWAGDIVVAAEAINGQEVLEQLHKEMLNNVDHEKDPNVPPKVR